MADVGRPTLYKSEYTQRLLDYFDVEPYYERITKIVTKKGDVIEVPKDEANDFPTLAGFAVLIGVHRDTLHEWSTAENEDGELLYPDFSDAYKRAKDFQEAYIAINGLKGHVNPTFAIFIAKNVLGWTDKLESKNTNDTTVSGQISIQRVDIDERVKRIKQKDGADDNTDT